MLRFFNGLALCTAVLIGLAGCGGNSGNECLGIDVSHHNVLSRKDWNDLKEQNVKLLLEINQVD